MVYCIIFKMEFINNENESVECVRTMDSLDVQLGSRQDIVYTTQNSDSTEFTMALFDGHGHTQYNKNPFTGGYAKHNLTVLVIQDMMTKKAGEDKPAIDAHLEKDIYSIHDNPAMSLQRAIAKVCKDNKRDTLNEGATFILVQVRVKDGKTVVNVLSVGDSTVIIHRNGEKVFESEPQTHTNQTEIDRLVRENRLANPLVPTRNSTAGFEVLDRQTLCANLGKYVLFKKDVVLTPTQSIGHIHYDHRLDTVSDEMGVTGIAPQVATFEFLETDVINIKGYSDGVSDVIKSVLPDDADFLKTSDAKTTANLAVFRWKQDWRFVYRSAFEKAKTTGGIPSFSKYNFGDGADDVSCFSFIQKH